jgi:hypothetical protein
MMPELPNATTVGLFVLLCVRSVLLWFVVPLAFTVWSVGLFWLWGRTPLRTFVRWADWNVHVALCRSLLRLLMRDPLPKWVPLRSASTLDNRVKFMEFF